MISLVLALSLQTALPEESVVRLQVYRARPDWSVPWRQLPVESGLGSGFLIDGGYIMTNAHVVRDSRQVLIKRHHVAEPFVARVIFQGDDCDLAVLKVDDPAFAKGLTPLKFGALPKARSKVTTYGYPLGGEEVSSTGGMEFWFQCSDATSWGRCTGTWSFMVPRGGAAYVLVEGAGEHQLRVQRTP